VSTILIYAGGLISKGPQESEVYVMDWDSEHLRAGITIAQSTWTITRLSGTSSPLMTKDSEVILSGARTTQVRLIGGVLGQQYDVSNTITTTETPPRIKDRSFTVTIEDM